MGRSSRLSCPVEEDPSSEGGLDITPGEWSSCIATVETDHLRHFTVEQSARDLGELVRAISPDVPVNLLGQSYGTLLLQRYPGQAAAVVLDSVANPGLTFTRFSERADRVGHDFLLLCGADSACSARLGPDPAQLVDDVVASAIDQNGCPGVVQAGGTRREIAAIFYSLLAYKEYRAVILPAIVRLARCNAADVDALTTLLGVFAGGGPVSLEERLFGQVLYTHLVLSEIWDSSPPDPDVHLAELQTLEFGILDVELDELWPVWPRYEPGPFSKSFPAVTQPLVAFSGTLDAQTPIEEAQIAADHYTGPTQRFVVVPGAPHGAIGGEPWTQPGPPCTVSIATAFIQSPSQPIDVSCMASVDPVALEPTADASLLLFGTADAWGDGSMAQPRAEPPPDLSRAREAFRRRVRRSPGVR